MRSGFRVAAILFALLISAWSLAQEELPADKENNQRGLKLMTQLVGELKSTPETRFAEKPLLRYSDAARGLQDASVWRLGEKGRPLALLTLEAYKRPDQPARMIYEFTLVSNKQLSLKSPHGITWDPPVTETQAKEVPDAPKPADNKARRLVQMKELIRRFAVVEFYDQTRTECRLMSRPIDRYEDMEAKIVDGAIFTFAHGTNPEAAVLLETDGQQWTFQVARLTSAGVEVKISDLPVYEAEHIRSYQPNRQYSAEGHEVDLP